MLEGLLFFHIRASINREAQYKQQYNGYANSIPCTGLAQHAYNQIRKVLCRMYIGDVYALISAVALGAL